MDSCTVLDSAELINKQTVLKKTRKQQFKTSNQVPKNSIYFTVICLLLTIVAINANANPNPSPSSKSNQYHDSAALITSSNNNNNNNNNQQDRQEQQSKAALEAELNSIVQQHDAFEGNNKLLAEAIISRLMVDNLTGSNLLQNSGDLDGGEFNDDVSASQSAESILEANQAALIEQQQQQQQTGGQQQLANQQQFVGPTGPEAMRLKKLLSYLQNYENNMAGGTNYATASMFNPFPLLPSGQATTMKRAAMKMGAYLQPQRHISTANSYPRNQFDFGLGKRPDSSISSNILRLGDSMSSAGGPIQPLNSFGKRPSAHRFDFGLGKRVASPAYPRYDFGLGKRAPNRIRYDFGLGKK